MTTAGEVGLTPEMVAWIKSRGGGVPTIAVLRPYGFAPGSYDCECVTCHRIHEADKRAVRCVECAAGLHTLTGGAP